MENQSKFDYLLRELRKYNVNGPVAPAVRIGKHRYIPIEKAYQEITWLKIRFIYNYLRRKGVYVRASKTSESIYFTISGVSFRVSDHNSSNTEHISHTILVKYDTCVIQVIANIFLLSLRIDDYTG